MIRVTSFGKVTNEWRDEYIRRLRELIPFEWTQIPIKRMPDRRTNELLPEEAKFLRDAKEFFILEADGKLMNSDELYKWCFQASDRHLVVGPAIGFHSQFKELARGSLSLSPLTFTHGLAQTILAETLYRSACILKNHPFVK